MDLATLTALLALFLITLVLPGPNMIVIAESRLASGPGATRALIAGLCTGEFAWAFASAFGMVALLIAYPPLLHWVKLAGAAWLAVLGLRMCFNGLGAPVPDEAERASRAFTHTGGFAKGLVTSIFSPNNVAFFVIVLPPMLSRTGQVSTVMCWVTVFLYTLIAVVWYVGFSAIVAFVRSRAPGTSGTVDYVVRACGMVLVGFGASFAFAA